MGHGSIRTTAIYLSRYTHKIGISNRRILNYDGKSATFSYCDRRDGNKEKSLTIPVMLFIRRFMQHLIPKRLVKIRFYVFMANRLRKKMLRLCKELISACFNDLLDILPGISLLPFVDHLLCPICKRGKMLLFPGIKLG
jgi:hypothetical protein